MQICRIPHDFHFSWQLISKFSTSTNQRSKLLIILADTYPMTFKTKSDPIRGDGRACVNNISIITNITSAHVCEVDCKKEHRCVVKV